MTFGELMNQLTQAAVRGDGAAVAACFTPRGTYHDVFYGSFTGPEAIAEMIENHFHRDGTDFRWDLHDPVSDGTKGYVRYVFSYASKLPGAEGRRALFEGISHVDLENGKIAHYHEIAEAAIGLHGIGFPPDRLAKFIGKQARLLSARDEARGHQD